MRKFNAALFFAKYERSILIKVLRKIYFSLRVRNEEQRANYLRDAGAKIGKGVLIRELQCLGSEPYLVEIGDHTSFSTGVRIVTHDGSTGRLCYMGFTPKVYDNFGKVKIGKNCFIGLNSIILKNVTIGDNCIIGAGSVVTKSIPPNSIAGGVPAKVISTVEEYVEKNRSFFEDTNSLSAYEKRIYIENHMNQYEEWRKEKEYTC